jgi:N-acetylglucosaminyldiphosphoundecaprenol N-acetyl-beta-D-mannosaminyltransferase
VRTAAPCSTADVFGIDYFCGEAAEAVEQIVRRACSGDGGYACFSNVHVATTARRDEELRSSLEQAWMVFPDGAPIAWLQRQAGRAEAQRVAGPDILPSVVAAGRSAALRHYLLGSTDAVLHRLRRRLHDRFPDALLVGTHSPRVTTSHLRDPDVTSRISATAPDIVWCALGAPKQELWMQANAESLSPALLLGVGAAFEFVAGTKARAPIAMQALGLEWLHRLGSEPRRLTGRYLRSNAEFLGIAVRRALTRS